MPRHAKVTISATELPQYRRLVEFLEEVEEFAELGEYPVLVAMVEQCRGDLARRQLGDE